LLDIAHDAISPLMRHDLRLLRGAARKGNEQRERILQTLLMKVRSWNTARLPLLPNVNGANLMT
jgi:hypothetical protein